MGNHVKPVQRWDFDPGTPFHENNESGEFVIYDDHEIVVEALTSRITKLENILHWHEVDPAVKELFDAVLCESNALRAQLSASQADLERAREAICCEHEWEPCFDVESQQDGMGCRRCDSFSAALNGDSHVPVGESEPLKYPREIRCQSCSISNRINWPDQRCWACGYRLIPLPTTPKED